MLGLGLELMSNCFNAEISLWLDEGMVEEIDKDIVFGCLFFWESKTKTKVTLWLSIARGWLWHCSEFERQQNYNVHLRTNSLGKDFLLL